MNDAGQTPHDNKKGVRCICGGRKYEGTPYCSPCWKRVPKELQAHSKLDHAEAYPIICEFLLRDPSLIAVEFSLAESPAKALVMIGLAEAQLDAVYRSASLDLKAIAIRALLQYDAQASVA